MIQTIANKSAKQGRRKMIKVKGARRRAPKVQAATRRSGGHTLPGIF